MFCQRRQEEDSSMDGNPPTKAHGSSRVGGRGKESNLEEGCQSPHRERIKGIRD
ncbi:hypothetical protein SISSUDRAFT_1047928 [Sistotremastrum suecicum HHB10207 ss-3]|uniref:Uncharacterized protein n=1 Tax=Sistotremastrum suecicum HHB10207 ss-3 TaxID=1314776 RepID=A0A166CUY4_9AGAM|nr:hypothetical protein SISSUDRAFT_1047928 [Sistotremastrum suecicum HHB10207 ss-3]